MSFDSVGDIGEKIVRDKSLENIRLIKLVMFLNLPKQLVILTLLEMLPMEGCLSTFSALSVAKRLQH